MLDPGFCVIVSEDVQVGEAYVAACGARNLPARWCSDVSELLRVLRHLVPTAILADQRFVSRLAVIAALGQHAPQVRVLTFTGLETDTETMVTAAAVATTTTN